MAMETGMRADRAHLATAVFAEVLAEHRRQATVAVGAEVAARAIVRTRKQCGYTSAVSASTSGRCAPPSGTTYGRYNGASGASQTICARDVSGAPGDTSVS